MTTAVKFDRDRFRNDVKARLSDPSDVCAKLGIDEGSKRQAGGLSVRCPAHNENTASCSVTVGDDGTIRVKCFACNLSGDVFSLIAAVRGLGLTADFPAVLQAAADLAGMSEGLSVAPSREFVPRVVQSRELVAKGSSAASQEAAAAWAEQPRISADAWEYLNGRGLADAADHCRSVSVTGATAHLAATGYDLALPMFDASGRVVAFQVRKLGARDFRVMGSSSAGVFGEPQRIATSRNVVLAEGLSDTLAAIVATQTATTTTVVGVAGVKAAQALYTLPLKGKVVLVAMDADTAGDETAIEIMEKLAAMGAVPVRARPVGGKDLCDMLVAGIDLAAFFKAALKRVPGFHATGGRLEGERTDRLASGAKIIPFGVTFLDAALGGIFPKDVILLGAATGAGKTELSRMIAQSNAAAGRRVHYFALEAEDCEIERRMKYARLATILFGSPVARAAYERLNYLDWYAGKLDDLTKDYEARAEVDLINKFGGNLHTLYPSSEFTIRDFERSVKEIASETDLIILDHFHFLDFGENENREAKAAIKRIRWLAMTTEKPILVVAHIRKGDRKSPGLIPVVDDFHGSSDVVKMATKAIFISPARDKEGSAPYLWPTYINAGKCRVDGSRARYVALVDFNAKMNSYDPGFTLGTVTPGGDKFIDVPYSKIPEWARQ